MFRQAAQSGADRYGREQDVEVAMEAGQWQQARFALQVLMDSLKEPSRGSYAGLSPWLDAMEAGEFLDAFLFLRYRAFSMPGDGPPLEWVANAQTGYALSERDPAMAAFALHQGMEFEACDGILTAQELDEDENNEAVGLRLLSLVQDRAETDPHWKAAVAWAFIDAKQSEQAAAEARHVLATDSNNPSAALALSVAVRFEDLAEAITTLESVTHLPDESVHGELACLYDEGMADADRAIEHLTRFINDYPHTVRLADRLETLLWLEDRASDLRELYGLVTRAHSPNSVDHTWAAEQLAALDNAEKPHDLNEWRVEREEHRRFFAEYGD